MFNLLAPPTLHAKPAVVVPVPAAAPTPPTSPPVPAPTPPAPISSPTSKGASKSLGWRAAGSILGGEALRALRDLTSVPAAANPNAQPPLPPQKQAPSTLKASSSKQGGLEEVARVLARLADIDLRVLPGGEPTAGVNLVPHIGAVELSPFFNSGFLVCGWYRIRVKQEGGGSVYQAIPSSDVKKVGSYHSLPSDAGKRLLCRVRLTASGRALLRRAGYSGAASTFGIAETQGLKLAPSLVEPAAACLCAEGGEGVFVAMGLNGQGKAVKVSLRMSPSPGVVLEEVSQVEEEGDKKEGMGKEGGGGGETLFPFSFYEAITAPYPCPPLYFSDAETRNEFLAALHTAHCASSSSSNTTPEAAVEAAVASPWPTSHCDGDGAGEGTWSTTAPMDDPPSEEEEEGEEVEEEKEEEEGGGGGLLGEGGLLSSSAALNSSSSSSGSGIKSLAEWDQGGGGGNPFNSPAPITTTATATATPTSATAASDALVASLRLDLARRTQSLKDSEGRVSAFARQLEDCRATLAATEKAGKASVARVAALEKALEESLAKGVVYQQEGVRWRKEAESLTRALEAHNQIKASGTAVVTISSPTSPSTTLPPSSITTSTSPAASSLDVSTAAAAAAATAAAAAAAAAAATIAALEKQVTSLSTERSDLRGALERTTQGLQKAQEGEKRALEQASQKTAELGGVAQRLSEVAKKAGVAEEALAPSKARIHTLERELGECKAEVVRVRGVAEEEARRKSESGVSELHRVVGELRESLEKAQSEKAAAVKVAEGRRAELARMMGASGGELANVDVPALMKAKAELEKKVMGLLAAKANEESGPTPASQTPHLSAAPAPAPTSHSGGGGGGGAGSEIVKQLQSVNAQLTDSLTDKDQVIAGLREQKAALGKTVNELTAKVAALTATNSGGGGGGSGNGSKLDAMRQKQQRGGNPF